MKSISTLFVLLLSCGITSAAITIDVYASSSPNNSGSPSWSGYAANALYALENGLAARGDRSTSPTGYERASDVVNPWEIASTSFKSWRGELNPTGAFADELGNRMYFGLHAYGDGTTQFKFEDLTFALHSSDAADSLLYDGNYEGYGYNTSRYGINWGSDRKKGGSNDVVYRSGNGDTLVDEIVFIGVCTGWWPEADDPSPSNPSGGAQAAMGKYYNWVVGTQPIQVTCTYTIAGYTGSDTVTVIPEPATLVLLGLGVCSAAGSNARKQR